MWEFEERFVKQQVGQSTGFARGVAAASGVICVGGAGSADIYEWDGSGWMHIQTLDCPVQPPPPLFGVNVAITESFAVVGSDDEDGQAGAVYIYARESGWSFEERLTSPNPDSGDRFGWAVAATGDRLVVGAPGEDGPACGTGGTPAGNGKPNAGACYVFRRGDAGWGLVTYLKGSNCDAGDGFGWGVDASDDWVLVGAIQEDGSSSTMNGASTLNDLPSAGAGYLFHVATTGAATQVAYMKATNPGLGDFAGSSVALDSGLAVLSTPNEDGPVLGGVGNPLSDSASNAGAAYAFDVNVWQGFSGCAAPAMSDVLLLAHSVAAKVGVVVELAAVDVLQAEGVTLLYVGAWGGDGFGCGVMIPGLGEVLLALSPTPVLVSFVASTSGYTDLAVGLPWDPALVGLQIAFQAARVTDDPGLPSLALSDALVTRIVP